jgi:hypothetical protein
MPETVTTPYRRLFQIRLLHHYWLDQGATVFDLFSPQKKRDERLLSYDVRPVLSLEPTAETAETLRGLGCVYRNTASGCIVAAPESVVIPGESSFDIVLTIVDPAFHNYTALTLLPQKIYDIYYAPEERMYRYKENVPLLSNETGASRGTGAAKTLYLSKEIPAPAADDKVESLVVSGGALMQLTGDQPGGGSVQIGPQADQLPVFQNQADLPLIVPPAGLVGAPAKGILLERGIPDNVYALIRLTPVRPGDDDFSMVDATGHPKPDGPIFDIRFKSRSTIWQYFNKSSGALISTEPNPLPLTYFGNPGTKQKPSEGVVKAVMSGDRITQLVSEVFI